MATATASTETIQTRQPTPQAEEITFSEPRSDESTGLTALEAEIQAQLDQEQISEATSAETIPTRSVDLPDPLQRLAELRIEIWRRLIDVEERRCQLTRQTDAPFARQELGRQAKELAQPPQLETLDQRGRELDQQLEALGDVPELDGNDLAGQSPTAEQISRAILQIGRQQVTLLHQRARLDAAIAAMGTAAAADEPLLALCRSHSLQADALFAWTYYVMAVRQELARCEAVQREHQEQITQARSEDRQNRSLLTVFSRSRESAIAPLAPKIQRTLRAARREIQAIEPRLIEGFWALYEKLAGVLVSSDRREASLTDEESTLVRACLRYGMVVRHPGLIGLEQAAWILDDCSQDVHTWPNTPQATHVVYADEYIEGIASQRLTVSPDEDLELNDRGSERWKADRLWRLATISRQREELFSQRLDGLKRTVAELERTAETQQRTIRQLQANTATRDKAQELSRELIKTRSSIARLSKSAEQIENRLLPKIAAKAADAAGRLDEARKALPMTEIVSREARFLRRASRLAARLRESYPPFDLCDRFEPGRLDHHSRALVLDTLRTLEEADQRLFDQVLIPNKRPERRVTVRMSPVFLLTPGLGQMGFSFCPRRWDDNGRFVLPLLHQRQNDLERLLVEMLADFRWDSSKEEAGMDWITADALCAAYSAIRWSLRRLPEKSQKAMGFDPRLKDRMNWRVHYKAFVRSAAEQGRLLFAQSEELYQMAVKYVGLPPDVEPLKRK